VSFGWAVDLLRREWGTISKAPILFVAIFGIGFYAGYAVGKSQSPTASTRAEVEQRKLSEQQRSSIISMLSRQPPRSVQIGAYVSDGEVAEYARDLRDVLRDAGWDAAEPESVFGSIPHGLTIVARRGDEGAKALKSALLAAGLRVGMVEQDADHPVQLNVGHR